MDPQKHRPFGMSVKLTRTKLLEKVTNCTATGNFSGHTKYSSIVKLSLLRYLSFDESMNGSGVKCGMFFVRDINFSSVVEMLVWSSSTLTEGRGVSMTALVIRYI